MSLAYFSFFGGHDILIHGLWTKHFAALLAEGNILPRFANNLNMGFGSFVFFFYPPLSLYFDSIFASLGNDADFYFNAMRASAHLSIFLSGVSCYYWLKNRAEQQTALLCALIYMSLPIHLVLDFYITGVMAQLYCYIWFPLIMLGCEQISEDKKSGYLTLSLSSALLVLTNIPVTIIFPPFAFLYGLLLAKKRRHYLLLCAAWLTAILLGAFYTLPLMAYKDLVTIDLHWTGPSGLTFDKFFLDQRLLGKKAEGHRVVTFFCFLLTILLGSLSIFKMKKSKMKFFFILACLVCIFMCFSRSKLVWEMLPFLQKAQFPRRLLIIPTVIIPLAATCLNRYRLIILLMMNLLFLFMIVGTNYKEMIDKNLYASKQDAFINNLELFPNYFPSKDVIGYFYDYPFHDDVTKHPKVITPGNVEILKWQSQDIELNVTGKAGDEIDVRQFWFPAWKAQIDGENVAVLEEDKFKILKIVLPHDVKNKILSVKFTKLPFEIFGLWISLLTFAFWLTMLIRRCRVSN